MLNTKEPEWLNKKELLLVFLAVALISVWALMPFANAFTWNDNSLKLYYKLDETSGTIVSDSARLINGTTNATVNKYGKINTGYLFDGLTQSIRINQLINLTGNWTFNFWVNSSDTSAEIISKWNETTANRNRLFFNGASGYELQTNNGTTIDLLPASTIPNQFEMITFKSEQGNLTLWINGSYKTSSVYSLSQVVLVNAFGSNVSVPTGISYFSGGMDEIGVWNKSLSESQITELWNSGTGLSYEQTDDLNISLVSPVNSYNTTFPNNTFVCNISATNPMANLTLYLWNTTSLVYNYTKELFSGSGTTTCYQETANVSTVCGGLDTGTYSVSGTWFSSIHELYDAGWNTGTRSSYHTIATFYINYTKPTEITSAKWQVKDEEDSVGGVAHNLTLPSQCLTSTVKLKSDSYSDGEGFLSEVNWSCYDGTNWILLKQTTGQYIWIIEEAMWWQSLSSSTTLNQSYNFSYDGVFNWNCLGVDSVGNSEWATSNRTLNYTLNQSYTQDSSLDVAGEGDEITFILNITVPTGIASTTANLIFNNTVYAIDTSSSNSTSYNFSKTMTIPSGWGNTTGRNASWYWNYSILGASPNKTTNLENVTIFNVSISDCDTEAGRNIFSANLKDEETQTGLYYTADRTTFIEVEVIISSWTNSSQTWGYNHTWINDSNISICVPYSLLNESSYKIDILADYGATDYVTKFWYLDNGTLNNSYYFNNHTNSNVTFYDLLLADSTTFLFTYTDSEGLEVDDAIIHTFRKYIGNGTYNEVERSKEDTNGETHVHLVEEDVIYYFMVTQYGEIIYVSGDYNAKCLSSPCSLSLSAGEDAPDYDILDNEGGKYVITSNKTTRVVVLTYSLEESATVQMNLYKFNNNNITLINSTSLTASSGSMNLTVPTSYGNSTFFVSIFRDGEFIKSEWIDFKQNAIDFFGTFGAILGGLILLALMMMAVSEGIAFIVFLILGLIVIVVLSLVDLSWLALISIVCAGGIIVWKLIKRRQQA